MTTELVSNRDSLLQNDVNHLRVDKFGFANDLILKFYFP